MLLIVLFYTMVWKTTDVYSQQKESLSQCIDLYFCYYYLHRYEKWLWCNLRACIWKKNEKERLLNCVNFLIFKIECAFISETAKRQRFTNRRFVVSFLFTNNNMSSLMFSHVFQSAFSYHNSRHRFY